MTLERGWRDRQNKALEKRSDSEVKRIRDERNAAYAAARVEAERVAAEEAAARAALRCTCPACDGDGKVLISRAELVIRALARLPSDSQIDGDTLGILTSIAQGLPYNGRHSLPLKGGLVHPQAARAAVEVGTVEEAAALAELQAETKPKPARRHVVPPHLED